MKRFIKNMFCIEMLPTYGLILIFIVTWAIIKYAEKQGYLDGVKTHEVHPNEVR